MLRFLRKYSNSTGIKILYGLLAGLFIIWGVGAVGGQRMEVVARVGGQPISRRDVERATAAMQRRFEGMPADLVRSLNLRERALDQLIEDVLIRQEAERLGLRVSEAELIEAITRMPEFQEDGRFSRERVEAVLRYQRDRGEFEDQLRRSILFQRLQSLVTDGVHVSDSEIDERYRLDHLQVNLAFVRVAAAGEEKGISVTDDELTKYLQDHSDRYRIPTKVRARYIAYRRADFFAQADAPESAVADYYDLHKNDKFTDPEQVHARHILVKVAADAGDTAKAAARKKAEDLLAKARGDGDFAALARKNSDDPGSGAKGGGLGFCGRGTITPAFESAALALEPGKVSDLIATDDPVFLLAPFERTEAHLPPLDEVRDRVATDARRERAEAAARTRGQALLARAKEVGLEKAAEEAGLKVEETGFFERQTATIAGLPPMPELRSDALTLTPDAPLAPKVYAAAGDTVVAALRERKAADPSGLASAKETLRDTLLQQKRQAVVRGYLDFLKDSALRAGRLDVQADVKG